MISLLEMTKFKPKQVLIMMKCVRFSTAALVILRERLKRKKMLP